MTDIITNGNEYQHTLSIHALSMLVNGMVTYFKRTENLFKAGDDWLYCEMRDSTLRKEALRLQSLLSTIPSNLVSMMLLDLKYLLEDLEENFKEYRELHNELANRRTP